MSDAFNCGIYVQKEMERVIERLGIEHVIETGTCGGSTSEWFAQRVKNVSTVEVVEDRYKNAVRQYKHLPNLRLYLGSSDDLLGDMITDMNTNKPILFYLDAHWCGGGHVVAPWPLLKELEIIGKLKKDNAIVVIDDFKVPHRNKGYDTYGGHECSLEYMQHMIPQIYRESPFIYFNDKHESSSHVNDWDRGKLYMFPASMKGKLLNFTKKENDMYYSNL